MKQNRNAMKQNEIQLNEMQKIVDLIINEIFFFKSLVNIRAKEVLFRITQLRRK